MTARPTGGYDVLAAFRGALDASPDPHPANVARALAQQVPAEHLREALAQALVRLAPTVAGSMTREHLAKPKAAPAPGTGRWAKAAETYRSELLRQRVNLAKGVWKLLGECTADDLRQAAAHRRDHARSVFAAASRLEAIAQLLVQRHVATVGDLPPSDLEGLEAA